MEKDPEKMKVERPAYVNRNVSKGRKLYPDKISTMEKGAYRSLREEAVENFKRKVLFGKPALAELRLQRMRDLMEVGELPAKEE